MDELAEIAASVAQALGLYENSEPPVYELHSRNVFMDPWRWMCLEWLLAHGTFHRLDKRGGRYIGALEEAPAEFRVIDRDWPPAEFPARAIHAITCTQSSS